MNQEAIQNELKRIIKDNGNNVNIGNKKIPVEKIHKIDLENYQHEILKWIYDVEIKNPKSILMKNPIMNTLKNLSKIIT